MLWKAGWALDTLRYRIEKDLHDTIFQNNAYREKKWNLVEQAIITMSYSGSKYFLLLLSTIFLWVLCATIWLETLRNFLPFRTQSFYLILDWQKIIAGSQAAIIGVIFPLVVGFVGVLLQSRSSNRVLWHIYFHYTGFLFAGVSGIGLVAFIGLSQVYFPWGGKDIEVIFTVIAIAWYCFNLGLLTWFLIATFRFVSLDSRQNLIVRFCTNDVFLADIRNRLA